MAQTYYAGETKIRPGVYHRYSAEQSTEQANYDGYVAFAMACNWGPTGEVVKLTSANSAYATFGTNDATAAIEQIFKGGASTVYCYRLTGTGGTAATVTADEKMVFTAKYVGNVSLSVKIQAKLGDATKNQVVVLNGTTVVETFDYAVGDTALDNIVAAVAYSDYITAQKAASATGAVAVGTYALTGGVNPTVANADYGTAVTAFEPYYYNVLATDSIESGVMNILKAYVDTAFDNGKNVIAVIGDTTDTAFTARLANAAACDNEKVVYFGSGWIDTNGDTIKGVKAIAYVAGAVASTPSTRAITRLRIKDGAEVLERLTNAQYESAIENGLLVVSSGPQDETWFDSGITTLIHPNENQDDGWKKIKRVKVRFELMRRVENVMAPKIGVVPANSDGQAYLIQCGLGVIGEMVAEGKLNSGNFYPDPELPMTSDSVWFIIEAADVDSLEKIYLHYKFQYNANA